MKFDSDGDQDPSTINPRTFDAWFDPIQLRHFDQDYTLSGWVLSNLREGTARIAVNSATADPLPANTCHTDVPNNNQWTRVTCTFRTPDVETVNPQTIPPVRVVLHINNGAGQVWFDNFNLAWTPSTEGQTGQGSYYGGNKLALAQAIYRYKNLTPYHPASPTFADVRPWDGTSQDDLSANFNRIVDQNLAGIIEAVHRSGYMGGYIRSDHPEDQPLFYANSLSGGWVGTGHLQGPRDPSWPAPECPLVDAAGNPLHEIELTLSPENNVMTILSRVLGHPAAIPDDYQYGEYAPDGGNGLCYTPIDLGQLAALIAYNFDLSLPSDPEDDTKVLLEWKTDNTNYQNSDDAPGFEIFRCEGNGCTPTMDNLMWMIDVSAETGRGLEETVYSGEFFEKTVERGHTYTYFIYSFDSDGNCAFTDQERNLASKACPPPASIREDIPAEPNATSH